ncbi:MAG: SBBP repeat-containing protein [Bacteroidota bacterium]
MKKTYLFIAFNLLFLGIKAQNFEWAKREGYWAYDYGYGIANDPAGNVYVAGKYEMNANFSGVTLPDQGNHDIYLAKYSSSGTLDWIKTGGGPLGDYAEALYCDGTSLYVSGEIEGYGTTITFENSPITLTTIGDNDIFLAKYDLSGNLLWALNEGGNQSDKALGVTADNNGNVYVCGYYKDVADFSGTSITAIGTNRDIFIAKYDMNGVFQWVRHAGSAGRDEAKAIKCDPAGNIYITGMHGDGVTFESTSLTSPLGYVDIFLAKYAPDGSLIWVKSAGSDYDDVGWGITMDAAGKIYITGEYNAYALFDAIPLTTSGMADIFVACYDDAGNAQWAQSAGGDLIDRARGIGCDGTDIYITGQFSMSADFGAHSVGGTDSSEIFMAKISNTGNFNWAIAVGGVADSVETLSYESGNAICGDASGNVYATGALLNGGTFGSSTFTAYSRTDAFITKISQGPDLTSPMAAIYSPLDDMTNVPNNTNLVLTFNEAIQKGVGNIIIKEGGSVTQTIDVTGSNVTVTSNVVTIDASDFTENTIVNIEMAPGVFKDMASNDYAGIANALTWNFTIGTATSIKQNEKTDFNIYPNPTNGNFIVKWNTPTVQNAELTVTNCLGQTLLKNKLSSTISQMNIDLSMEEKGIYFIEVKMNQTVSRKKIILQ